MAMPLFEGGRINYLRDSKMAESYGIEESRWQLQSDLDRNLQKAKAEVLGLRSQRDIAEAGVAEAEKVAKLTYNSYKSGKTSYLEVQSMNLKALEWKVQLATIKTQLLMQLSAIENLTGNKTMANRGD